MRRPTSVLTLCSGIGLFAILVSPEVRADEGAALADVATHERFCHEHWLAVDRCHEGRGFFPQVLVGADLGVAKMNESGPFGFGTGVGSVTNAGPAWGLRVGIELLSWLAFEARYSGMRAGVQAPVAPTGSLGFLMTSGQVTLRLTAPLPYVHPYVFGGVGYYEVALSGGTEAKGGSPLFSSSQVGLPMGIGVDVPLSWHLSLGAEATYHFQLGEVYSNDTTNGIDGGDISTFNVVVRARL